jgi:hypothetical protein
VLALCLRAGSVSEQACQRRRRLLLLLLLGVRADQLREPVDALLDLVDCRAGDVRERGFVEATLGGKVTTQLVEAVAAHAGTACCSTACASCAPVSVPIQRS